MMTDLRSSPRCNRSGPESKASMRDLKIFVRSMGHLTGLEPTSLFCYTKMITTRPPPPPCFSWVLNDNDFVCSLRYNSTTCCVPDTFVASGFRYQSSLNSVNSSLTLFSLLEAMLSALTESESNIRMGSSVLKI